MRSEVQTTAHRDTRGFTLFEVLAASLVLVLVGTLTIGSMNADLSRMSEARLRLEAGRIADSALADIEATLFDGTAPTAAANEEEIDGFVVRTRVAPFGLLFQGAASGEAEADEDAVATDILSMIGGEFPGLPKHLRMVEVKVLWGSVDAPYTVERTTLAFDHTGALEALENAGNNVDDDDGGASQ